VTGGQIGFEKSRLDFDLPEPPTKESLTEGLNALIADNHPVTQAWISEAELDANPGLVRTLSVQPPRGAGRIRLVRIGSAESPIDLQPCGGTHVRHTGEIGRVEVTKIENKGRQNRRVSLTLLED
jgi:misacylated tRNA(Ala) deacylase